MPMIALCIWYRTHLKVELLRLMYYVHNHHNLLHQSTSFLRHRYCKDLRRIVYTNCKRQHIQGCRHLRIVHNYIMFLSTPPPTFCSKREYLREEEKEESLDSRIQILPLLVLQPHQVPLDQGYTLILCQPVQMYGLDIRCLEDMFREKEVFLFYLSYNSTFVRRRTLFPYIELHQHNLQSVNNYFDLKVGQSKCTDRYRPGKTGQSYQAVLVVDFQEALH